MTSNQCLSAHFLTFCGRRLKNSFPDAVNHNRRRLHQILLYWAHHVTLSVTWPFDSHWDFLLVQLPRCTSTRYLEMFSRHIDQYHTLLYKLIYFSYLLKERSGERKHLWTTRSTCTTVEWGAGELSFELLNYVQTTSLINALFRYTGADKNIRCGAWLNDRSYIKSVWRS